MRWVLIACLLLAGCNYYIAIDADYAFPIADCNGDGKISPAEASTAEISPTGGGLPTSLDMAIADKDKNGFLDRAEFKAFFNLYGAGHLFRSGPCP